MNLEEVQFSRLIEGCIVKIKYPVEVQAQLDVRRYNKICEDSKGDIMVFSLSPGEYYKVFEVGTNGSVPISWLDLVMDTGWIQPCVHTKYLTLDDECSKYNEEIFKNREWEARIAEKWGILKKETRLSAEHK